MIKIRIALGDSVETREFSQDSISFGRAVACDVRLNDKDVSRHHAVIEKTAEGFVLRDQDSRNGTLVNQNRIESAPLAAGDVIQVGDAVVYVDEAPPPTTRTWVAPPVAVPASPDDVTVIRRGSPKRTSSTPRTVLPPREHGGTGITVDHARRVAAALSERCRAKVRGRDDVIEQVLIAVLAGGHVLLEDYPGSGKTTLAKALGGAIAKPPTPGALPTFRRIQFTPDLLPSDVTGVTLFEAKSQAFVFRPGPVFANVVLADEINRTSPKVQAALLEAMAEKQVTVDNETHPLEDLFCVIATQNPLDSAGTYPLPVAQLDRFLFKIRMKHLSREKELEVLGHAQVDPNTARLERVKVRDLVDSRPAICAGVKVSPILHELLVDMAQALRADKRVAQGVSTRSLVLAIPALQVRAMMHGRDFVTAEDLRSLAVPLFGHRLVLKPGTPDAAAVVAEAISPVLERAARATLTLKARPEKR